MEKILSIDVGGTSIKYGLWNDERHGLEKKGQVVTPDNLTDFYQALQSIVAIFKADKISGIGFSIPGAVDQKTGIIGGISALPYIHDFPIQRELSEILQLPVALENDANCAALAEIAIGSASKMTNILFIIIGTGIGGAVVIDRKIIHGNHLLGGEFGMILNDDDQRLSLRGTAVHMSESYNQELGSTLSGKQVLELSFSGDLIAEKYTTKMFDNLARAIYNLQFTIDPEAIVIGGGVSASDNFMAKLRSSVTKLAISVDDVQNIPTIISAKFQNDANLIGAAYNYLYN